MREIRKPIVYISEHGKLLEDISRRSTVTVSADEDDAYNVGDSYGNYGGKVSKIWYTKKRWYEFWKKKKPMMYEVTFE